MKLAGYGDTTYTLTRNVIWTYSMKTDRELSVNAAHKGAAVSSAFSKKDELTTHFDFQIEFQSVIK